MGVIAHNYGNALSHITEIRAEIALKFNRKRVDSTSMDVEKLMSLIGKEIESHEATMNIQNSEN